jgi:membrane protease subunit (stomatin/prohibitin family)
MALIDIVKIQGNDNEFVVKFPSEDLRIGTQVIVNTSQTAFFVKGGKILDQFESGTHSIKTENIPLLNKLINLPFGGNSPFQAEVWFVNLITKLDLKWGTTSPIQLEDPKYGVIVPVRAYGQYGFKISNPRLFIETLVGNMKIFTADKIDDYFKGKVLSSLTSLISTKLISDNVSVLEINSLLDDLSNYALNKLNPEFGKFGIELVNFYFISVNIPESDPSIIKLKEAKDLAAKIKILGRDIYQMDRSFDVLDKAAENEGGIAGSLATAGLGIGIGAGIGSQIGGVSNNLNTSVPPIPPAIPTILFYAIINNQQEGPFDLNTITQKISAGLLNKETLVWKAGMENWAPLINQKELAHLIMPPPFNP